MQLFSAILVLVVAASIIGTFVISFWILIKYKLNDPDEAPANQAELKRLRAQLRQSSQSAQAAVYELRKMAQQATFDDTVLSKLQTLSSDIADIAQQDAAVAASLTKCFSRQRAHQGARSKACNSLHLSLF